MREMTWICVKCLKYVRNNGRICEITYVYRKKRLVYVGIGLNM